jgi:hypothetical protein
MPHAEETFYKMKCGWSADPKVAALGRFGPVDACLARDVFGQMIDYARRELTDGLVPAEVVPFVAHPLPADDAMRVAMHLADPGPYGPLCGWDARSNAFSILAYPKWNDTRAEVQARKEKGSKAARTRWDSADARGNAGGNARGIATGNAAGIHRAPAHVDTEQEQEQEQEPSSSARNADPRGRAGAREDDDDDSLNRIIAMLHAHGPITRDQAIAYRAQVTAGRRLDDPNLYAIAAIRRDPKGAYREAITATAPATKADRQPPKAATLCTRCGKTDHRAEQCPTLAPGAADPGADVTRHGAEQARKLLADRLGATVISEQAADPGHDDDREGLDELPF